VLARRILEDSGDALEVARVARNVGDANWAAVEKLEADLERDEEAVNARYRLATRADILQLLGRPTYITTSGHWEYHREAPGGSANLLVYFQDGLVREIAH
jgi:hypothetical protein